MPRRRKPEPRSTPRRKALHAPAPARRKSVEPRVSAAEVRSLMSDIVQLAATSMSTSAKELSGLLQRLSRKGRRKAAEKKTRKKAARKNGGRGSR
ncbi:MAG: hypothetical protein HUU15_10665 [Candidatus Brocadiae bacterium]|nr:hypothetical protein [Candidatus Brocadiia bacterium]